MPLAAMRALRERPRPTPPLGGPTGIQSGFLRSRDLRCTSDTCPGPLIGYALPRMDLDRCVCEPRLAALLSG